MSQSIYQLGIFACIRIPSFQIGLLMLIASGPLLAFAQVTYTLAPSSVVAVEGGSTISDWSLKVNTVRGEITWSTDPIENPSAKIIAASLRIPVTSLEGRDDIMDQKTYAAFASEANPDIRFDMISVEAPSGFRAGATVTVKGPLNMAGQTQQVSIPLQVNHGSGQALNFVGATSFLMSSWGMEPPTAFFGTLEVEDSVTVQFQLVYQKS